jgi:hypothetical protein
MYKNNSMRNTSDAVVQRNSSILTFAQEKDLAENTYKKLVD